MRRLALTLLVLPIACGGEKSDSRVDPAVGHALLREYVTAVKQVAAGGGLDVLDPVLTEQAKNGEALQAAGKLSAAFAERHRRLIDVTRAMLTPNAGEAEKQKVRDFLDAVEGKKERALEGGLAEVGPALIEEVLRLHMLLDGTTDREKTRARYQPDLEP